MGVKEKLSKELEQIKCYIDSTSDAALENCKMTIKIKVTPYEVSDGIFPMQFKTKTENKVTTHINTFFGNVCSKEE